MRTKTHSSTQPDRTSATPHPQQIGRLWLLIILTFLLALIVTVAHYPALSAKAIFFDDELYLINNPLVQNPSWTSAERFLTEILHPSTVGGYYQPLAMISLMLDCAVGGSPDNLLPFHLTSLVLHVANTLLVFFFTHLLFRRPWAAAAAALIFGLHPITVESIPWVAERKTLLTAFFAILCFIFYVQYTRRPGLMRYTICLILYILALMSKPTSLMLPVLMLLLDFWPLNRLNRRALLEKIPLLVIASLFALIAFLSQAKTSAVIMPGEYPPLAIPLVVCHNIVFYLWKVLWPTHISAFYPYPRPISLHTPAYLWGVVGTVILLPAIILSLRWTRVILSGWLFFFLAMLPAIGIIGYANTIAADRFAYFPMVGLLMSATYALSRGADAATRTKRPAATVSLIAVFIAVLALAEASATRRYLARWSDSMTLYAYLVDLVPESEALHYNYAELLTRHGRSDEAITHYREAIRINPIFAEPHTNLGILLLARHQPDIAIEQFEEAARLDPDLDQAWTNLANTLIQVGRPDEAVARIEQAIRRHPGRYHLRLTLASALIDTRQLDEAIRQCKQVLAMSPDQPEAYALWGLALMRQNRYDEAIPQLSRAVELQPAHLNALLQLAEALQRIGRHEEAINAYSRALALNPNIASAHNNMGIALARLGRLDQAIEQFAIAARLDSTRPDYQYNLARARSDRGHSPTPATSP